MNLIEKLFLHRFRIRESNLSFSIFLQTHYQSKCLRSPPEVIIRHTETSSVMQELRLLQAVFPEKQTRMAEVRWETLK